MPRSHVLSQSNCQVSSTSSRASVTQIISAALTLVVSDFLHGQNKSQQSSLAVIFKYQYLLSGSVKVWSLQTKYHPISHASINFSTDLGAIAFSHAPVRVWLIIRAALLIFTFRIVLSGSVQQGSRQTKYFLSARSNSRSSKWISLLQFGIMPSTAS